MPESKMSENKRDYQVGRGQPPVHSRFKKGQSGNPRGPRPENLPALLVEALNEKVTLTIDGERREITKRGGGHQAAGQQIDRRRFARDQNADRHREGHREKDRRDTTAGARLVQCGGRRGDATFMARLRQSWEDRAVLDAYGWTYIRSTCKFELEGEEDEAENSRRRRKLWRYRWPQSVRDEVLARLLALNAQRAKEERFTLGDR